MSDSITDGIDGEDHETILKGLNEAAVSCRDRADQLEGTVGTHPKIARWRDEAASYDRLRERLEAAPVVERSAAPVGANSG